MVQVNIVNLLMYILTDKFSFLNFLRKRKVMKSKAIEE